MLNKSSSFFRFIFFVVFLTLVLLAVISFSGESQITFEVPSNLKKVRIFKKNKGVSGYSKPSISPEDAIEGVSFSVDKVVDLFEARGIVLYFSQMIENEMKINQMFVDSAKLLSKDDIDLRVGFMTVVCANLGETVNAGYLKKGNLHYVLYGSNAILKIRLWESYEEAEKLDGSKGAYLKSS